jgi:histidinol phosphatase-like enzyme
MGIRTMNRPAIFLDRDGVLNSMVLNPATGRMESPLTPADFQLFHGVMPALRRLQKAGYLLILASNQPNYALGKTSYEPTRRFTRLWSMLSCSLKSISCASATASTTPEASRQAIRMRANAASRRRDSFSRPATILVSPSPIPG